MSITTIMLCDDYSYVIIPDPESSFSEDGVTCHISPDEKYVRFGIHPDTNEPFEYEIIGNKLHKQEFYHSDTDQFCIILADKQESK
jgi:hypothetical protein